MIGIFLSIIPRSILITAAAILGIILFYEGLPFASYVPFVGGYFTGRVGHAYERGQLSERKAWEDQRRIDLNAAQTKLEQAQAKIDALNSEFWKAQTDQAIQISDLEHELENEKADNAKSPAGACHPAISRRVRNRLAVIGN